MTRDDIENWFTYHAPTDDERVSYEKLRNDAKSFAFAIFELVPECADKTHAMRLLRDCVMWANAAIACKGK